MASWRVRGILSVWDASCVPELPGEIRLESTEMRVGSSRCGEGVLGSQRPAQ